MHSITRGRPIFAPRYRVKRTAKSRIKRIFIFVVALLVSFTFLSEWALSSISDELIFHTIQEYIERRINKTIADIKVSDELLNISRDDSGKIISATADTQKMNVLKTDLTAALTKELKGKAKTTIPFGSITDIKVFNGRGFPVPLKINLEGAAQVSFQTEFLSAGINQSCYRVTLLVDYSVYSQSKNFAATIQDSTSYMISETIIVGNVPQFITK